jgi:hypothetical protein
VSLATVVDALAERLRAGLPTDTRVGDGRPAAEELPAVTLSLRDVSTTLAGLGRTPRGTRRGALHVQAVVDLADPVVELDGDRVPLLSPDRRVLTLPHGQLVRVDGTDDTPLDGVDLAVAVAGDAVTVVPGPPAAGEVRPDPVTGTLRFGVPLPSAGSLTASYHLGQWDVRTVRFSGVLDIELAGADTAAVAALSRQVGSILDDPLPHFTRLLPAAWGSIGLPPEGADQPRSQVLGYGFDFEREEPALPSGGGLIRTVEVTVLRDGTTEVFLITPEGSPA